MLSTHRKKTIIACISMLAMTLAVTAFAETIGQKIMRLKREKEQGVESSYTREKAERTPKKVTGTSPKTTDKVDETVNNDVDEPAVKVTPKPVEKTIVSTPKVVPAVKDSSIDSSNPMDLVPADALVCLRINNFNNAVQNLDSYATGLLPMPVSLSMMAAPQIANLLGSQLLSGIDFAGDVVAFIDNDMGAKEAPIVIMVPVTSYQEFISGNPNCSKADADGISTIAPPKSMLGKLLTVKAPGGKYAYVCMEDSKPTLMKAISSTKTGSFGAKLTANEQKLASTATLWVCADAELASAMLKPAFREMMPMMPKTGDVDMSEIILGAIDQLKTLSLTLNPTAQKLALGLSITAKPGTEIAKTLAGDPAAKSGFQLAGYLDGKAGLNLAAKLNKSLITNLFNKSLETAKSDPAAAQGIAGVEVMAKQNLALIGDELAFSISASNGAIPVSFKNIMTLSDGKKAMQMYDQQFSMMASMQGPDGTKMGEITAFGNDKIYSSAIPMPLPSPGAGGMPKVNTAISGDKMFISMGDVAEMKSLIQKSKSGAVKPSGDMAKALQMVDNSAEMDFVASLNLISLISLGGKAASALPVPQAQMAGSMLKGLDGNSMSCMAVSGKIDSGRFDLGIVMPKDHLGEVVNVGMQMFQKIMMQKMMQDMPNGQPGMNGGSGNIKFEVIE